MIISILALAVALDTPLPNELADIQTAAMRSSAHLAWGQCIIETSEAISNSPDPADLVARSALYLCEDKEATVIAEVTRRTISAEDQLIVSRYMHARMMDFALAKIIRHRAQRALERR